MPAHAHEIIPGLWLGDCIAAEDPSFFKKHNIKALINCTPDIPNKVVTKDNFLRLNLNDSLKDIDTKKMIKMLPGAVAFLHQKKDIEKKNILVNCIAGMQRSATVVTAYLSKYYGMSLNDAINLVASRRPQAFHHAKHLNFSDALFHYTSKSPSSSASLKSSKGKRPIQASRQKTSTRK